MSYIYIYECIKMYVCILAVLSVRFIVELFYLWRSKTWWGNSLCDVTSCVRLLTHQHNT